MAFGQVSLAIILVIVIIVVEFLAAILVYFLTTRLNSGLAKKIPIERKKYEKMMRKINSKEYSKKLKKYIDFEKGFFTIVWCSLILVGLFYTGYYYFDKLGFWGMIIPSFAIMFLSVGHVAFAGNLLARLAFKLSNPKENSLILYYSSTIMNPGAAAAKGLPYSFKPDYSIEKFNLYFLIASTPILLVILLLHLFL